MQTGESDSGNHRKPDQIHSVYYSVDRDPAVYAGIAWDHDRNDRNNRSAGSSGNPVYCQNG